MARLFLPMLVLACGLMSQPVSAKSVYKQFDAIWADRQSSYDKESDALNLKAKAAADYMMAAVQANSPDLRNAVINAIFASRDNAKVTARYNFLREFRDHIATKPLPEITQTWLQGRADTMRSELASLQRDDEAVNAMKAGENGVSALDLISKHELLEMRRGKLDGEISEMTLVAQNAQSYFQAAATEKDSRRNTWAAIFGGIATSMQQQQAQAQRNWNATCQRFGNRTQCFGN